MPIETLKGGAIVCTGASVETFRLLSLASALDLESKGIKIRRGFNALKMAKGLTGMKSNDRAKQAAALRAMAHANESTP